VLTRSIVAGHLCLFPCFSLCSPNPSFATVVPLFSHRPPRRNTRLGRHQTTAPPHTTPPIAPSLSKTEIERNQKKGNKKGNRKKEGEKKETRRRKVIRFGSVESFLARGVNPLGRDPPGPLHPHAYIALPCSSTYLALL
jgi:hypothetical protein